MRVAVAVLVLAGFHAASPSTAPAQYRGVRFEITAVNDTTFAFRAGAESWMKAGLSGIVVDPRRRDALVARFRIIRIAEGDATAVVTGQTTNVRTEHVAVLEEPRRHWLRSGVFWGGLLLGAVLGAGTVGATR